MYDRDCSSILAKFLVPGFVGLRYGYLQLPHFAGNTVTQIADESATRARARYSLRSEYLALKRALCAARALALVASHDFIYIYINKAPRARGGGVFMFYTN